MSACAVPRYRRQCDHRRMQGGWTSHHVRSTAAEMALAYGYGRIPGMNIDGDIDVIGVE